MVQPMNALGFNSAGLWGVGWTSGGVL